MYAIYKRTNCRRISNEDEDKDDRKHVVVIKKEEEDEDDEPIMNREESEGNDCSVNESDKDYFAAATESTSDNDVEGENDSATTSDVSKVAVYDDTRQLERKSKLAGLLCIIEAFM